MSEKRSFEIFILELHDLLKKYTPILSGKDVVGVLEMIKFMYMSGALKDTESLLDKGLGLDDIRKLGRKEE